MRAVAALLFLLFSWTLQGQTQNEDNDLQEYIESCCNYVLLSKVENMPLEVRPHYQAVLAYLDANEMDYQDYYLDLNGIHNENGELQLPLYREDGLRELWQLRKYEEEFNKNRKEGDWKVVVDYNGNMSGADGHIVIDMKTGKVKGFSLWM